MLNKVFYIHPIFYTSIPLEKYPYYSYRIIKSTNMLNTPTKSPKHPFALINWWRGVVMTVLPLAMLGIKTLNPPCFFFMSPIPRHANLLLFPLSNPPISPYLTQIPTSSWIHYVSSIIIGNFVFWWVYWSCNCEFGWWGLRVGLVDGFIGWIMPREKDEREVRWLKKNRWEDNDMFKEKWKMVMSSLFAINFSWWREKKHGFEKEMHFPSSGGFGFMMRC